MFMYETPQALIIACYCACGSLCAAVSPGIKHCLLCSQEGGGKPVSDQWLPPFVIVDDAGKPVGTIEVGIIRPSVAQGNSDAT